MRIRISDTHGLRVHQRGVDLVLVEDDQVTTVAYCVDLKSAISRYVKSAANKLTSEENADLDTLVAAYEQINQTIERFAERLARIDRARWAPTPSGLLTPKALGQILIKAGYTVESVTQAKGQYIAVVEGGSKFIFVPDRTTYIQEEGGLREDTYTAPQFGFQDGSLVRNPHVICQELSRYSLLPSDVLLAEEFCSPTNFTISAVNDDTQELHPYGNIQDRNVGRTNNPECVEPNSH